MLVPSTAIYLLTTLLAAAVQAAPSSEPLSLAPRTATATSPYNYTSYEIFFRPQGDPICDGDFFIASAQGVGDAKKCITPRGTGNFGTPGSASMIFNNSYAFIDRYDGKRCTGTMQSLILPQGESCIAGDWGSFKISFGPFPQPSGVASPGN